MAACLVESEVTPFDIPLPITNNDQKDELQLPDFSITRETLVKFLVDEAIDTEDSIQRDCGGIFHEIVSALKTSLDQGIPGDGSDLHHRHRSFGPNVDLEFEVDDHRHYMGTNYLLPLPFEAFKDPTIILLLCCATLSLVIGIKRNGLQEGIRDGAMLFLAILVVVSFGSACKFFKARRMTAKYLRKTQSVVRVVRGGTKQHIAVPEIVVGDVLCPESGDFVPVDGLLVHNQGDQGWDTCPIKCKSIFSGEKVAEGNCRVLVTSVGRNTERSRLMMRSIGRTTHTNEESRLKAQIEKTYSRLEQIWLRLSLLILVVQVVRCFGWEAKFCDENHEPDPKGVKNTLEEIMNETTKQMLKNRQGGGRATSGLVAVLCMLVFALRDGLPLGIFVLFVYGTKKMKSVHNVMVRKLPACATLGLVSTICANATGDLTLDHTKIADMWIGLDGTLEEVPAEEITRMRHNEVLNTLGEGISLCASGQKEDALLWWAKQALGSDDEEMNRSRTILHRQVYDHNMKLQSGVSLRRKGEVGNIVHVHWKGRPDIILSMCSHYYDASAETMATLDAEKRASFNEIIKTMSSGSLQCFAFAYKKVVIQEKLEDITLKPNEEVHQETIKLEQDSLIFVSAVVLKSPFHPEVRKAVDGCRKLGVNIKLLVSCDMQVASLIAIHSGILNQEENKNAVIEASELRNCSKAERQATVNRIRIMANCSPSDKLLMVQCLQQNGEVVAAIGTTIRDSPVLKAADIGLFVDAEGSESGAKDADIVMYDLNVGTIYSMLVLGRCTCNSLGKFLEFHLTFNPVAFTVNFIIILSTSELPLSPFELLWVNLVMDVLGALAVSVVARAAPSEKVYKAGPVMTKSMLRNVLVQSSYQVTALLILYLKGKSILHVDEPVLKAMIFNCYVLCQVFGLANARKVGKTDGSIDQEASRDNNLVWFIAILGFIIIMQAAAVELAAVVGHTGRLNLKQWGICIGIASVLLVVDSAAKRVFKTI